MTTQYIAAEYARLLIEYCDKHTPINVQQSQEIDASNVFDATPVALLAPYVKQLLALETNVPMPWRVGEYINKNTQDMFGYSVMNSPNVKEAQDLILKYYKLLTNVVVLGRQLNNDGSAIVEFTIRDKNDAVGLFLSEMIITQYIFYSIQTEFLDVTLDDSFLCESNFSNLINKIIKILEPKNSYYKEGYFTLEVSKQIVNSVIPSSEKRLRDVLLREMSTKLDNIPDEEKVSEQVAQYIKSRLKSNVTLDDVCEHFHKSRRTLSRLLEAEGLSFKKILNDIRREKAMSLIRTTMPLKKVATESGFNSVSTFSLVFKEWVNCSPANYRQSLEDDSP